MSAGKTKSRRKPKSPIKVTLIDSKGWKKRVNIDTFVGELRICSLDRIHVFKCVDDEKHVYREREVILFV